MPNYSISFFHESIFLWQWKLLEKNFQISSSVLPNPTFENFFQKWCLVGEIHFFERPSVSKLYILFLKSFLCTPLMNHTKTINIFLMRTKINEKKISPKVPFSFVSPALCNLTYSKVIQESLTWKKIHENYIFWKKKF